jgi:hypothetical protein
VKYGERRDSAVRQRRGVRSLLLPGLTILVLTSAGVVLWRVTHRPDSPVEVSILADRLVDTEIMSTRSVVERSDDGTIRPQFHGRLLEHAYTTDLHLRVDRVGKAGTGATPVVLPVRNGLISGDYRLDDAGSRVTNGSEYAFVLFGTDESEPVAEGTIFVRSTSTASSDGLLGSIVSILGFGTALLEAASAASQWRRTRSGAATELTSDEITGSVRNNDYRKERVAEGVRTE